MNDELHKRALQALKESEAEWVLRQATPAGTIRIREGDFEHRTWAIFVVVENPAAQAEMLALAQRLRRGDG